MNEIIKVENLCKSYGQGEKGIKKKDRIIGYSEYRDGSILDEIHEV